MALGAGDCTRHRMRAARISRSSWKTSTGECGTIACAKTECSACLCMRISLTAATEPRGSQVNKTNKISQNTKKKEGKEIKYDEHVEVKGTKLTSDVLKSLKNSSIADKGKDKIELDHDDLTKLATKENLNEYNDFLESFVVKNEENKKDFLKENYKEIQDQNKVDFIQGWGTWTGLSEKVQAKEFLIKKRLKDIQDKKTNEQWNSIKNKNLKVSNSIDKKFSNYMVKVS